MCKACENECCDDTKEVVCGCNTCADQACWDNNEEDDCDETCARAGF